MAAKRLPFDRESAAVLNHSGVDAHAHLAGHFIAAPADARAALNKRPLRTLRDIEVGYVERTDRGCAARSEHGSLQPKMYGPAGLDGQPRLR